MRVVCENCGATYKIPESKLIKAVNKATCRKCGYRMLIQRPMIQNFDDARPTTDGERTLIADSDELERKAREQAAAYAAGGTDQDRYVIDDGIDQPEAWDEEGPTKVHVGPDGKPISAVTDLPPIPVTPPPAAPPSSAAPAESKAAPAESKAAPASPSMNIVRRAYDPGGDLLIALIGAFAAAGGALLLAVIIPSGIASRMIGLFLALCGSLVCLFILLSGNLGRQKASLVLSFTCAMVLSGAGTTAIELSVHDSAGVGGKLALVTPNRPKPKPPPKKAKAEPPAPDASAVSIADLLGEDALAEPAADEAATDGTEAVAAEAAPAEEPAVDDAVADVSPMPGTAAAAPVPDPKPDSQAEVERRERREAEREAERQAERQAQREAAETRRAEEAQRRELEREKAEARRADEMRRAAEKRAAEQEAKRREQARAAAAPAPASKKMKTLPLTVVDTIIRSNMSIKKCFAFEKTRAGSLPRSVNVRFTVLASGRINSARIPSGALKGGELDRCLGRAFRRLQFPAFEGDPVTMTYPFVL